MKLVPDWRSAWRWHSTQAMAVAAALPLVWAQLPPDAKAFMPPAWEPYALFVLLLAGIVGRVRDQG